MQFDFEPDEIRRRVIERAKTTGKFIPMDVVDAKMAELTPAEEGEFDSVIIVPITPRD